MVITCIIFEHLRCGLVNGICWAGKHGPKKRKCYDLGILNAVRGRMNQPLQNIKMTICLLIEISREGHEQNMLLYRQTQVKCYIHQMGSHMSTEQREGISVNICRTDIIVYHFMTNQQIIQFTKTPSFGHRKHRKRQETERLIAYW